MLLSAIGAPPATGLSGAAGETFGRPGPAELQRAGAGQLP
jgi:hypothetical protein